MCGRETLSYFWLGSTPGVEMGMEHVVGLAEGTDEQPTLSSTQKLHRLRGRRVSLADGIRVEDEVLLVPKGL